MLRPTDFVIGGNTPFATITPGTHARGLIPRPFDQFPQGCYRSAPSFDMPTIDRNEWADRIREGEASQSFISHVRRRAGPNGGSIPSLDQDGKGFCWAHSSTMAVMLTRALMGEPYVRLSAFMPACIIKSYRDEGGWGAQSLDFITDNGVPSVDFWPEKSMSRSNDNPAMRTNAALHKAVESWADLSAAQYDRNLTEDQAMTCLLSRIPLVADWNWWSHSTCMMDATLNVSPTEMTTARWKAKLATDFNSLDLNDPKDAAVMADVFGKRGINSWTDQYGDKGEFVLTGNKAHLDGGVAPRVSVPSVA